MNKGKLFEGDFQQSAKNDGIWVLRLSDSSLSWQKEHTARFTVQNPFDFLMFEYPALFAVECKSTTYKSMSIQRGFESESDKKKSAMIKAHQISALTNASLYDGIYAGFLLNFRNDEDIHDNITYWLPIEGFTRFLLENDKQSINKLDCVDYGAFVVKQKLKRTRYTYDIKDLINRIKAKNELQLNNQQEETIIF